jgi:hypothetical protein
MLKNKSNQIDGESLTYIYFIISTIILILVYYIMYNMNHEYDIKKNNLKNNIIVVQTENDIIKLDPDMFDIHINRLKNNLILLNKNFTENNCENIKKYLDKSNDDMKNFIKMQNSSSKLNVDDEFCNIENNNIIDSWLSQEKEMLEKKLVNKNNLLYNESTKIDEFRLSILNIIIDIEIITFLIRNSLCKNSKINLINLHKLIAEMYNDYCVNNKDTNKNNIAYNDMENNYEIYLSYISDFNKNKICLDDYNGIPNKNTEHIYVKNNNSKLSQDINCEPSNHPNGSDLFCNESENILYSNNMNNLNDENLKQKKNLNCHAACDTVFSDSDTNTSNISKKPITYNPWYNINYIRNERNNLKNLTTDINCSRSLRNDYDFIDI